MLSALKSFIRFFIPKPLFKTLQPIYHGTVASLAAAYFGQPSLKLQVYGVTGTAGKSTTVMMAAHILNSNGYKTGYITTAGFSIGDGYAANSHNLSMPGGWLLQKQLAEMVRNGCKFAIVECTSEGMAQNRHLGIDFKGALFTNLTPAHLDAHGSFENYRAAKGRLFALVEKSTDPHTLIGANLDDPNRNYFMGFGSVNKFGVSTRTDTTKPEGIKTLLAEEVKVKNGLSFDVEGIPFEIELFGTFNVSNALLAIGLANFLGISLAECAKALSSFNKMPGRMEVIENRLGITAIVDYAPEPAAMEASLQTARLLPHKKIIHVFGSTGGHRDKAKRFEFGSISARYADVIIVTNDDVYDSDPEEIAGNIRDGIARAEEPRAKTIETILDRKAAIKRATDLAEEGDVILVTGKGSEAFLVLPGNERIAWDDREELRKALSEKE